MEHSKIKLFLEYFISLNTKDAVNKTDAKLIEAQGELEVLKQNKDIISQRVPKIEGHVKTLGEIINLSTVYESFKSAKVRAESTGILLCKDIESLLKDIRAHQSSEYTVERETRQKVEANGNGNTDELLERRKAGIALAHDNPDITDLSDPNRPTKIAERWSELYDNEWTDAFDDEVRSRKVDEKEVIVDLLEVVKSAYQVCAEKAADEFKEKPPEAVEDRNYFRKTEAHKRISELQKEFLNVSEAKLVKHGPKAKSMEFIKKCVELCWWMGIQEKPVHMYQVDDKKSNADFYRAYTKSGSQLDYLVWPALRLYKDGPLLYRGVAQFK